MANFKIVISDPETRKSFQTELDQDKGVSLIGKKIDDEVSGSMLGLSDYTLKITGGSDKDGFPMYPSLNGQSKRKLILIGKPGYHPQIEGQRKRKTVRGNTISQDISQINVKVVKKGTASLEEMFGKKEQPKEGGEPSTETK